MVDRDNTTAAKPNPYEPTTECKPETPSQNPNPRVQTSLFSTALAGSLWSIILSFPITALMALVFRFPVPFAGIDGGLSHVIPAMFALLCYGVLMGGFVLVAVCGGLAGLAAHLLAPTADQRRPLQLCLSFAVTFVLLFVLATLDWYIGPW